MRRMPLALGLALACVALPAPAAHAAKVLVLGRDGHVGARVDRFVPARDERPPSGVVASAAARAKPAGPTVRAELDRLLATGQIDQPTHDRDRASYDAAEATLRRLHGARLRELKSVVATLDVLAAHGQLVPTRLAVAFATLDANRRWWTTGPLLRYGQRVELSGSDLVWQAYPGEGIQVQWLGTFGKANGLFTGGTRYDGRLGKLLDEARGLATARAGGIAWESLFHFDGGSPPWVSALSQGTALQAFSRAAVRLGRPAYFQVARDALGIFDTPPPEGVRVVTPLGAHYLIYSFAPSLRVLNAFTQAVIGLHDFAQLANDPTGGLLYAQGENELRAEVPRYDTGAWSLYSQRKESDLGYHTLLRDFLRNLCTRLQADHMPDPTVYCTTAQHFTAYLEQPPRVVLQRSPRPRVGHAAAVRLTLSKVSRVTLAVRRGGALVATKALSLGRGVHTIGWGRPRQAGVVSIAVRAVDPAGNAGGATGAQTVRG